MPAALGLYMAICTFTLTLYASGQLTLQLFLLAAKTNYCGVCKQRKPYLHEAVVIFPSYLSKLYGYQDKNRLKFPLNFNGPKTGICTYKVGHLPAFFTPVRD